MRRLFVIFAALLLSSCATFSTYNFSRIDNNCKGGNYSSVVSELEKNKSLYGDKEIVLKNLDYGLLNHYIGNFEDSNKNFETAEEYIRKYYAKSISQNIGSYIVNDLVKDYEGDFFEDIYVNIFMALNYLSQGDEENAFVEIRKFDEKMKILSLKYVTQLTALEKELKGKLETKKIEFHNSALARYLSLLMYRTQGDKGNAKVDLKYINDSFARQASIYNFPVPSTINYDEEIAVSKEKARLNVLAFTGLCPVKKEEVFRISFLGKYYKLALPKLIKRPSEITGITLTAKNIESGAVEKTEFELLENLENISESTFSSQLSVIKGRALVRSISKTAAQVALSEASRRTRKSSGGLSALFSLGQIVTAVATEATEKADIRVSRYFPAKASVASLTLNPGTYEITVDYKNGTKIISSTTETKTIKSKKLNFMEKYCLQ